LLAVILLVATAVMLGISARHELPTEDAVTEPVSRGGAGDDRERYPFPPAIEFPAESPDLPNPEVSSEQIAEIRMRLLASIAEDFKASLDEEIPRMWLPSDQVERAERENARYLRDPTWPRIAAVPGVAGFEIQRCPRSQCISDWLAEETDDPAWARPMEARIMAALGGSAERGLAQIFVVCREASCGVVLPPDSGSPVPELIRAGQALSDTFGFSHHSVADRSGFQAIYLTRREQPPEKRVQ